MKFKREYLKELGLPSEIDEADGKILTNKIVGTRRWSTDYTLMFWLTGMPEDQAWMVGYSRGSTECQDETPWEYEDEVQATLMHKVEKVMTIWEAVQFAPEEVTP